MKETDKPAIPTQKNWVYDGTARATWAFRLVDELDRGLEIEFQEGAASAENEDVIKARAE